MAATETAAEVRDRIGELLSRSVRLLRIVLIGSAATVVLLVAVLGVLVGITADTNSAVKDRAVLESRNAELETQVSQLEDVNGQAVDAIVAMAEQIRQLGGTPPEVVLRPSEPGE